MDGWGIFLNSEVLKFHEETFLIFILDQQMMFRSATRILISSCRTYEYATSRSFKLKQKVNYGSSQISYIKSEIHKSDINWSELKANVLTLQGTANLKNIDAILLKNLANEKRFEAGLSFVAFLKQSNEELGVGTSNGILNLYYEFSKERELSNDEKKFILNTHKDLYAKYKVLDYTTGETLLHALCAIGEWKKAIKVLDDICLSHKPTHSAYSVLIATLFQDNNKNEALKIIEDSIKNGRPLQTEAYKAWIKYVLKKYKDKKTILKYLEEICVQLSNNEHKINFKTAEMLQEMFRAAGWDVQYTRLRKFDGQCICCKEKLDPLKLSEDEFAMLQKNVKDKLIVGSDLFLKTSPDELKKFLKFVERTAPYDVVIDALNTAFAAKGGIYQRISMLNHVVDHFKDREKNILLLGRKHMLSWPKMQIIMSKTTSFFTDDLSQDDPYFITAAILSGSHTDIVSKDLLRGHLFLLQDPRLQVIFRRWQWQHQWMVHTNKAGKIYIQEPLKFNPYAQKNNCSWHLPYEKEQNEESTVFVNYGAPDLFSWLCLRSTNR